jgi:hypothetical protein
MVVVYPARAARNWIPQSRSVRKELGLAEVALAGAPVGYPQQPSL